MLLLKFYPQDLLKGFGEFSEYSFFVPVKDGEKVPLKEVPYEAIPPDFKFDRTTFSAKELLLPPEETIFYFLRGKDVQEPVFEEKPRIILGIRPCDCRGIQVLEANFLKTQPVDPYFKKRRENTLVISVSCPEFQENCFCDYLGDGPGAMNGADAIIFPTTFGWAVLSQNQAISSRLEKFSFNSLEVDEGECECAIIPRREKDEPPLLSPEEYLSLIFNDELWEEISSTCLGCASCTYHCPTCYCFDIQDITLGPAGKRVRTYDSCMFNQYTLEASGHNPRPSLKERWRQRFLHKFSYIPYLFGILGCTGCGRCIDVCPSGIDIREVIRRVSEFKP
ncbi:MAG: 4Fe-4S dicluster domain-containing protein [Caldiserica bacterium]|jgi:ferredoxin|nr:4Fe-4S dicluster domain-containing protein [Caldisericota bacterium]MDH7561791.1 4Fe-4S dicluster domain-containing protein [Caldisericota bacterium]